MIPAAPCVASTAASNSDRSLLRQFRQGSSAAAEQLYRRYADRIRALACHAMTSGLAARIEADDIVQSVFRRFFMAVEKGRYDLPSGEELGHLLVAITLNRVRSEEIFQRAAKRDLRQTVGSEGLDRASASDGVSGELEPVLSVTVADLIEHLDPDLRQVVAARMEGFEVSEIATQTGRSKRTVERMLQESRNQLRSLLEANDR